MEDRVFLYHIKQMNLRLGRVVGIRCGVIHAKNRDEALAILIEQAGNSAYSFNLLDVTDNNGEAYIGIPSGELLAFDNT